MTMNNNVVMISRHRQWRAWQFGVRHGGLWRGGGSANDEDPKWLGIVTYAGWTAMMWWLFGWAAGVTLLVIAAVLFAFCVWIDRRQKRGSGEP